MADKKITEFDELAAQEDVDLLAIVDDPTGSAVTKKITRQNLFKNINPGEDKFSGLSMGLTADVEVTLGEVCYILNDGDMAKADASVIATSSGIAIATATIAADAGGIFLLNGVIHLHTMNPGWTIGGLVYLALTAGDLTQTAPSATDEVIQILGVALDTDILHFNPQLVQVEHT